MICRVFFCLKSILFPPLYVEPTGREETMCTHALQLIDLHRVGWNSWKIHLFFVSLILKLFILIVQYYQYLFYDLSCNLKLADLIHCLDFLLQPLAPLLLVYSPLTVISMDFCFCSKDCLAFWHFEIVHSHVYYSLSNYNTRVLTFSRNLSFFS